MTKILILTLIMTIDHELNHDKYLDLDNLDNELLFNKDHDFNNNNTVPGEVYFEPTSEVHGVYELLLVDDVPELCPSRQQRYP